MNLRLVYLVLCVLGALLPLSQFLPWVVEHGLDIPRFFEELFSTKIGGFFGLDVIVSAVVLIIFVVVESKRLKLKHTWVSVAATLSVGVSLGLPLFLYMRQVHIEKDSR